MSTAAEPVLPRGFLQPCVLLLLREAPAHGYDLLERMQVFGFSRSDPGRLYRVLRSLEDEGLVRSSWESSGQGPDRRVYTLTRSGMEALHARVGTVAATATVLERFLSRYSEFVALGSGEARAVPGVRGRP